MFWILFLFCWYIYLFNRFAHSAGPGSVVVGLFCSPRCFFLSLQGSIVKVRYSHYQEQSRHGSMIQRFRGSEDAVTPSRTSRLWYQKSIGKSTEELF